jgi:PAS domain S-box-containing protein
MRQNYRKFGALGVVLVALVLSLVLGLHRINRMEDLIATEVTNAMWAIGQVEVEFLKFTERLDEYYHGEPEVTRDDVVERFDILWSRLPIVLDGQQSAAIREIDGLAETVEGILRALESLEPVVSNMKRGDSAAHAAVHARLDPLAGRLHEAVVDVYHQSPWRISYRYSRSSYTRLQIALAFVGILVGGGGLIFLLVREIRRTDRLLAATLEAQRALEESEARLAGIMEIAPEAIISVDEHQHIRRFNKGAESVFGYAAGEVLGRPLDVLLPERFRAAHPGHVEEFLAGPEVSGLMNRRLEIFALHKDGSEFPAEASISKLEQSGETILTVMLQDITKRRQAEQTLIFTKVQAEVANRAKSDFLTNMSHELRTPLNAVIGFADILSNEKHGPLGAPEYRGYAELIGDSGQYLLDLINDILDLAKIEAGKTELQEDDIEVSEIVRSCVMLIAERAHTSGVKLVTDDGDVARLVVHADPRKLKQILVNLLSNAVKFTPSGGTITIATRLDPDRGLLLRVSDTGIGMVPEDVPKALERFGQVGARLDRGQEGTGIGLPLTKSLVELHGGSLELESELGAGTTATVILPAQRIVRPSEGAKLAQGATRAAG